MNLEEKLNQILFEGPKKKKDKSKKSKEVSEDWTDQIDWGASSRGGSGTKR